MDRFEQLTAYFVAISDFHKHRDSPICNVVALTTDLPNLLEQITQPQLRKRLQSVMAANGHLLPATAAG